jgi:hypothetical protein
VQGTTTHKVAYTEATGTTAQTYTSDGAGGQYIALDARGEVPAPLYLTGGAYDLCLKTAAGATVWTRRADPSAAETAIYTPAGTGATTRTVQDKLRESVSVKDFGATGDGTTDDAAAIQAAVDAARRVYFPEQTGAFYKCATPITLRQDTTLEGANKQNTVVKFFGCSGFIADSAGAGTYDIQIRNLSIIGNGSGTTTDGIRIDGTSANFGRVCLDNLIVNTFTRNGVSLIRPIVSEIRSVQSSSNGAHGFYLEGDGTSVSSVNAYASLNTLDGFHILNNIQYSSFISCASDDNGRNGYWFNGAIATPAEGITMVSCGAEINAGDQFKFSASLGITLSSIFTFPDSPAVGGHFINLDGVRHATLTGVRMDWTPAGGKYALNLDSLSGTQFPGNIKGIGCSFSSINNTNNAYLEFKENTVSVWTAATLTNSWVDYGGSEATAAYFKDQFGVVHLKGSIKSGTFSAAAFNLPAGYRPAQNRNFGTVSNNAFGYVNVSLNGNVTPVVGSTVYLSLDGIYFLADA